jgi:YVTN family beta-propeller protein
MNRKFPYRLGRIPIFVTIFALALVFSAAMPSRAGAAACTSSNLPTGRTLFAIDNTGNQVVVVNGSTLAVACTIAVGNGPTNLAVSPDSSTLFVENDTDGTVSVVTLGTLAVTTISQASLGTPKPMSANIAVSPDGTFAYLVSIPTTFPAPTQAQITVIQLPSLATAAPFSVVTSPAVPVTAAPVGVAFTPNTTAASGTAYVVTEDASYAVNVATQAITLLTDSANAGANVVAGGVAVDPGGAFAYAVEEDTTATNATLYQIIGTTVTGLNGITPLCDYAGGIAITAAGTPEPGRAYYTCADNNFIQAIQNGPTLNQSAVGTVTVGSPTVHPQGISIPYDGATAYVTTSGGTLVPVDIATSTASSPVTLAATSHSITAVVTRPSVLSGLSPANPSVKSGSTQDFTATLSLAENPTSLVWSVSCTQGGAACGSINTSGQYTAPNAIPTGGTVTVSVTSTELPPVSSIYPLTTTVTITPSQLAFQGVPATGTAGSSLSSVQVAVEDAAGNVDTSDNTTSVTINSTASNVGGTTTATVVSGVATFTNLVFTKTGSYTLTASATGLAGATSTSLTITAGPPTQLAFTVQPTTGTAGTALASVDVSIEDANNNVVTSSTASVSISSTPSGAGGTTVASAVNGVATFTNLVFDVKGSYTLTATSGTLNSATSNSFSIQAAAPSRLAFTTTPTTGTAGTPLSSVAVTLFDAFNNVTTSTASVTISSTPSGVSGTLTASAVNGVATFNNLIFTVASSTPYTLTASSSGLTSATSGSITISPAAPAKLAFTTQPASGALGGNVTPLGAVAVTIEDTYGNLTSSTANVTISSTPASVKGTLTTAGVAGVATFGNLQFTVAGTYTLTAASTGLTSATSSSFTLTTNIVVNVNPTPASVMIEDAPGADVFTASTTGDPNTPPAGVTWVMYSCGASTTNLAPCGSINAQTGGYTPPTIVPGSPTFVVQATSITDPSKAKLSGNVTISSNIAVTVAPPTTTPASTVLLEKQYTFTATVTGDPALKGVVFALSCPDVTPCGTLGTAGTPTGNATSYTVTVSYTAPTTVLATASHATVSATSIADPSKPAGTTTVTITSNISISITATTAAPNEVVFGTTGTFAATVTNAASISTVTWSLNCGASGANACGTITSQGNYTPPAVPPSPATFTVTATSVADPSKTATTPSITIAGDLLVNDPNNPAVSIATTASSGTAAVDLFGPSVANPGAFTFSCSIAATVGTVTGGTCTFSLPNGSALPQPYSSTSANGTNSIGVTLSVLRATSVPGGQPWSLPSSPSTPLGVALLSCFTAALLFLFFAPTNRFRLNRAFALVLLLCLTLGWMSACTQFKTPGPLPPLVPPTEQAKGTLTITATSTAGQGFSAQSVQVPFTVN